MKNYKHRLKYRQLFKTIFLLSFGILIVISIPLQLAHKVAAGCSTVLECDSKINAKNQDINKYNLEIARLSSEAQTLQSTLSRLENERAVIQAQLDISQANYDKLVTQIADTEKQIIDNKDALGVTIANLYVEDKITPVEMLFSSKNVSDYLDKQEYRNSVRDELTLTIGRIKTLKADLETQKVEVDRVLKDQKSQRDTLLAKGAEQQNLLNETNSNTNAYQRLSNELANQILVLQSDRMRAAAPPGDNNETRVGPFDVFFRNWSGNIYCGGGYEYCQYNLDAYVFDPWGLHLAGECVHYTAWALANRGYYIPYNAFSVYNGYGGGNANKWVAVATDSSHINGGAFATLVSTPQTDDLAFMPGSGVGHVGIVEQNYGDGWVRISQYNYAVYNNIPMYSTIDLKITNDTEFLRFNK